MKTARARALLGVDIEPLGLGELQRHKVKLLDAWRESKAFYGMEQAVRDGFYVIVASDSASGFSPADIWLTHELEAALDRAEVREAELLGNPPNQP